MQFVFLLLSLLSSAALVSSYSLTPYKSKVSSMMSSIRLNMADEKSSNEKVVMTDSDINQDPNLFDMNRIVRLGRSKDQDGKSNIWSIEPTMEVVEEEESSLNSNLKIAGVVIGAAIATLPLFNAFSTLFPDPADF